MIISSGHLSVYIDIGDNKPGMKLQRFDGRVWGDYLVNRKLVKSPVDIETLPPDKYRLV